MPLLHEARQTQVRMLLISHLYDTFFQPVLPSGEEKAVRRPQSSLPVPEGAYKKAGEGLLQGRVGIGQGVKGLH